MQTIMQYTPTLIKDEKELAKRIDAFAKKHEGVDGEIHDLACSALLHCSEHGNSTMLTRLVQAMPKSFRRQNLIDWVKEHSDLTWQTNNGEAKFKKTDSGKPFTLEEAYANPFFNEVDRGKPYEFSMAELIKMIKQRVDKANKNHKLVQKDLQALTEGVTTIVNSTLITIPVDEKPTAKEMQKDLGKQAAVA